MATATYVPGTREDDPKKIVMSLQQLGPKTDTNTANIATNTTNITALQTAGTGLVNSGGSLAVSLSKFTNSLGADKATNASTYTDGPSVAQGSTGTWFASGTITLVDTSVGRTFSVKLYDGTTVIASANHTTAASNSTVTVALSGYITSPAGNIRIAAIQSAGTTGKILFNQSGNSMDSTISAIRIA
jgi:hypothetical protein